MLRSRLQVALLLAVLAGCAAPTRAAAPVEVTTVYVVRHAEKATEPKEDPPLTEAGAARAQGLVRELAAQTISAVLSTDTTRTRATAAPLVAKLGLTTELVDAKPAAVAQRVLSAHRGQTVVVIGHSNTVTGIVAALGAVEPPEISDDEFDNLYVVRVPSSGAASLEMRKYKAPAAGPTCPSD